MKRIPKTPVEFDYDLWTTEDGKCMVRVKITGEVTEVDREVMKILRVEEKRVRRSYGTDDVYADEPSDSTPTLLSLDAIPSEEREASAWLMDPSDFTKETAFNAGVSDFLKYLTANQQRVFIECFLKGQSYKEYAEETTWHLVTTKDFVNVEYKGEAIKRGGDDKPNKNAYTGSVIKDKENLYHAFFTAYNEDIKINGKSVQSVMQAVGTDLEHLNTVEEFLFVSDGKQYEEFDWRDPFVYWNEEDECYDMLLASRIKGGGELRGGCIALCKSKDLKQWTYEKPFYAPGMYITMECPEIFKMGNYWYLVFSTFSDQFTTHYRISKSPNGPWEIPEDDVFDTRSDYAIKTASDGQRRFAFGWIASKYGNKDFGPWEWGGTMVFHELIQNPEDGTLKVRVIPGVKEFYDEVQDMKPAAGYNSRITKTEKGIHVISDTLGSGVYEIPEDCFSIEMDVCVKRGHEFGIALHVDSEMEKGYFLRMNQRKKEVAWDMWPRSEKGIYQWQIKGDVPYQIETSRRLPDADEYHLLIIREDDICIVYINDEIVLSTRMYDHKGGYAGVYVVQGEVELNNFVIKTRKERD